MASPSQIDPSRCPLCGASNRCAMETARETGQAPSACWCQNVTFTEALRARVPPEARDVACLCPGCAAQAQAEAEAGA